MNLCVFRINVTNQIYYNCYLLSVMPQPLAVTSNDHRCLNYNLKQYFHVSSWSVLMNKFPPHIRYNFGPLLINCHI